MVSSRARPKVTLFIDTPDTTALRLAPALVRAVWVAVDMSNYKDITGAGAVSNRSSHPRCRLVSFFHWPRGPTPAAN